MKGFTKGKGKGKKFIPTTKKNGLKKKDIEKKGSSKWINRSMRVYVVSKEEFRI